MSNLISNSDMGNTYTTWIIAYCPDTDTFFTSNQRCFWWEFDDEFQCENDAVNYFKNHFNYFVNMHNEFKLHCSDIPNFDTIGFEHHDICECFKIINKEK